MFLRLPVCINTSPEARVLYCAEIFTAVYSVPDQIPGTVSALEPSVLLIQALYSRVAGGGAAGRSGANPPVSNQTFGTWAAREGSVLLFGALNPRVARFGDAWVFEAVFSVSVVSAGTRTTFVSILPVYTVHIVEARVGFTCVDLAGEPVSDHVVRTVPADRRTVKDETTDSRIAGYIGAEVPAVDPVSTEPLGTGAALEPGSGAQATHAEETRVWRTVVPYTGVPVPLEIIRLVSEK